VQDRARRLRKRLKSAQKRLCKLASHRDESSPLLNERLTDGLSAASRMATPSRRNLHDQRKAIKHLRDIMSLSAEPSYRPVLKALGDAKDSIGEWHDWEELQRLARKNLKHGRGCKLISILGAVSQKKFNEALRVTKGLRRLLHSERIHSTLPINLQMSASHS